MIGKPTLLTDDYRKTQRARAVPYAYFGGGAWWLPPDPDPDSARVALKLFPQLAATNPELVARARLSAVDHTPIDLSTARWRELYGPDGRRPGEDPWQRVAQHVAARGWEFLPPQRMDADAAIAALNAGHGYYLGHEMGLGKTLAACMVIDGWPANFVFIAAPSDNKQDPWVDHLRAFCPWLEPVVVGHTAKARAYALDQAHERISAGEPTALICHYAAIPLVEGKTPSGKPAAGWRRFGRWDLMVLDEAHQLKGRPSTRADGTRARTSATVAALMRMQTCGHLLLSGSVMSGAAEDLFTPYKMMRRKRYRSRQRDWIDPYLETVQTDYGEEIVGPRLDRLPAFRAELGTMLTVRPAKRWLPSIPEPRILEQLCPLLPEQQAAYTSLAEAGFAELPDGNVFEPGAGGAALVQALRRVTGGVPLPCPSCHNRGWMADDKRTCPLCLGTGSRGLISAKVDKAVARVMAAGDSQAVLFTWHKVLGRELQRRFLELGVPCGLINGDVGKLPRAALGGLSPREYERDLFKRGGYRVLVATISTLSTGVNLQNASYVGMVEEDYDPVNNEQSEGRALRQGQLEVVTIDRFRSPGTVDTLQVMPTAASKAELRRLVLGAAT